MRTTFLNLILLFVIVGCKQPTINKVQQAVEAQTKLLVDSGLIANEYVVLYELAINDSNHIYSIQAADCPADLKFEYPSKIIKYKDKYLCFIELDEQEMSRNELFEKGIVADSNFQSNSLDFDDGFWLLALQKYGKEHVLVKYREEYDNIVEMPELWPYLSGGSPQSQPVFMSMDKHYIVVADSLSRYSETLYKPILWSYSIKKSNGFNYSIIK